MLAKVASLQVLGKSPAGFYLRVNNRIWQGLPSRVRNSYPVQCYGAWLNTFVRLRPGRRQYSGTFFLRNRPAFELMRRLVQQKAHGSTFRIAVLGCSIGADVYSILWILRSARPDLKINLSAVDISKEMLNLAQKGIYGPNTSELVGAPIFERLTTHEKRQMFNWEGDQAKVKSWLRKGIAWRLGDAADPELKSRSGDSGYGCGEQFSLPHGSSGCRRMSAEYWATCSSRRVSFYLRSRSGRSDEGRT